ncbi:hypothetical protein PB01_01900 [Psychrobacillus glaciei]|uniref:Uncharacterized protein n=1 Tax=Psychrobacillus glaciei TaxID=2283160 RepID=A0A5J6SJ68_9BACI|nr:hypothetical protein PB01_01900 [Psychrobacillus glaciei]
MTLFSHFYSLALRNICNQTVNYLDKRNSDKGLGHLATLPGINSLPILLLLHAKIGASNK